MSIPDQAIDKALRSKVLQILAIATFLWGVIIKIVLPLSTLQIQSNRIEERLISLDQNQRDTSDKITALQQRDALTAAKDIEQDKKLDNLQRR